MLGPSDQNDVTERRNQTLMDMVRCTKSNAKLPQYLWIKAPKTVMYVLRKFLTKVISKTPFELFKGWKSRSLDLYVVLYLLVDRNQCLYFLITSN